MAIREKLHNFPEKLCITIAHAMSTQTILEEVVQFSEPTVISDVFQQTSDE